jgi:hypothetical protein
MLNFKYLQQFAFKPATNKNIKPIAGLRPATLLVVGLSDNCCKTTLITKMNVSNDIIADTSSMTTRQVTEIKNQLSEAIKQLSPERLKVLADFAAFLANAESEAATQELLSISGLLERVKQNQATPKSQYINWRTVHSDV